MPICIPVNPFGLRCLAQTRGSEGVGKAADLSALSVYDSMLGNEICISLVAALMRH